MKQKWICTVAGIMIMGLLSACGEKEVTQLPGEEVKEEAIVSEAEEEAVAEEKTEASETDFEWVEEDGNMVLRKYHGTASSVTVPDTVDGKSVVAIGYSAFSQNESIEEVILPDTITEIREKAFFMSALEKCNLPESLEELGELSLACQLQSVEIPYKLQVLPRLTFAGTNLEEVVIPGNIKEIGNCVFQECKNLRTVKIEDGVEKIGDYAFEGVDSLEEIMIPASVMAIEKGTFRGVKDKVIIITPAGSYAEQYAIENEIAYQNE